MAHAALAIGLRVTALLSEASAAEAGSEAFPHGTVTTHLPAPGLLDAPCGALLAGAGALQALTSELAHARHTNPDLIRREQAPYRQAAAAASSSVD